MGGNGGEEGKGEEGREEVSLGEEGLGIHLTTTQRELYLQTSPRSFLDLLCLP